jgi:hypothetical protein
MIILKYSKLFTFLRLFKRTFLRVFYKMPICNGNYETLSQQLTFKDSILVYQLKNYDQVYENIQKDLLNYPKIKVIEFNSPKQLELFLDFNK